MTSADSNKIVAKLELTEQERLIVLSALDQYNKGCSKLYVDAISSNLQMLAETWKSRIDTAEDVIHRMYEPVK